MAIAPIVGKLRKRLITDLTAAMGLGISLGYVYWYTVHLPSIKQRDDFYLKYEAQKKAAAEA